MATQEQARQTLATWWSKSIFDLECDTLDDYIERVKTRLRVFFPADMIPEPLTDVDVVRLVRDMERR